MRTRTVLAAAAAPAALAAVLLGTASTAAHASTLPATPKVTEVTSANVDAINAAGVINGNADIPSGQNVQLRSVHVTGQVTVEGTLAAAADVFDHNVVVTGGNLSLFNQPSHIKGNLWVLGSPGDGSATSFFDNAPAGLSPDAATANGSVIGGDFTFAANSGRLYVGGPLTVGGNFVFALNTGPASDYSSSMTVNGHRFVS